MAVTSVVETVDKSTGEVIFENHSTVFLRGAHGVGGKRTPSGSILLNSSVATMSDRLSEDRGAATAANVPPKRAPDAVVEEKTSTNQAALYRCVTVNSLSPCSI